MNKTLNADFIKEKLLKDERFIRIHEVYTPNFKKAALTSKFYSKYENYFLDPVNPVILNKLIDFKDVKPQEKYTWPATENQNYGWWIEPLYKLDRNDKRFYNPKICSDFIKHYLRLQEDEKGIKGKKFTGIPFKVQ